METEPRFSIEWWLLSTTLTDRQLCRIIVADYVVYRATQHLRQVGPVSAEYIEHHMSQLYLKGLGILSICMHIAKFNWQRGRKRWSC